MAARIDDFSPDCWVVRRGILNSSTLDQYLNSVYWAFTTVTTVGYGDIYAYTQLEMLLSITWMITGVGFYSFTIGSLSSFLSAIDTRDSLMNAKLAATHELAKETGIAPETKRKITAVVTYNTQKLGTIWSDKHSLFYDLPIDLRYEVARTMFNGIACEIPFLKHRDSAFVVYVMPRLRPLLLKDGGWVYREGDYASEVLMLVRGRANLVLGKSSIAYKSFLKGSLLGEVEIIFKTLRIDTVQTYGKTEFLTLSKRVRLIQDFIEIIEEFPVDAREIKKVAREKARRNRKAKEELIQLIHFRSEVGSLRGIAGQKSDVSTTKELEYETPESASPFDDILTDVKATLDCVNDLQERTTALENSLNELLSYFKGLDEPGTQTSMASRLHKRRQTRQISQKRSVHFRLNSPTD
jgi:hyperpolarization activated cyclic nucleotide-gated potassium channel 1